MSQIPEMNLRSVLPSEMPGVRVQDSSSLAAFGGGERMEGVFRAIGGVAQEAGDIADQAKQRADQVAHMNADLQVSKLQTDLQTKLSTMQGQAALGAPEQIQQAWSDGIQKIRSGLSNAQQQMAFDRTAGERSGELYKAVHVHVADQVKQLDQATTSSYLETSKNAATVNAFDDDKVGAEVARTTAVMTDYAQRHGTYYGLDGKVSPVFQTNLENQISGLHADVIKARLDKDDPGGIDAARDYLAYHKDEMKAQDYLSARKLVENSETVQQGMDAWARMQGPEYKLANGMPNLAKMEHEVMASDEWGDQKKLRVMEFVKTQARWQTSEQYQREASDDRSFYNEAIKGRQQGMPLDQAMNLVKKYGRDDYDQALKTTQLQKIYEPPDKTDPKAFLDLFQKGQDGTLTRSDADHALQKGQLSISDHRQLSETAIRNATGDEKPEQKTAWARVKNMADEAFGSDRDSKAKYIYDLQTVGKDMEPEQLIKTAKDKLEAAPGTGWFGSNVGAEKQYKVDVQRLDAQNLAWGKAYEDLGKPAVTAIGQGALYQGKQTWGLGDLDAFAQRFGGIDKIKPGQPAGNAIQSLAKHGQMVTPSNVDAVLRKYPDGRY